MGSTAVTAVGSIGSTRQESAGGSDASAAADGPAPLPPVGTPSAVAPSDARELSRLFLARLAELEEGTPEYQYARNTLVELNLSLVRYAVTRFRHRPELREDLTQVGTIGLIKAIDRFDTGRGVEFTSFAVPYIVGEIKRFFRDGTWAVHVPRRLQELRVTLAKATEELHGLLGRSPTVQELADRTGLTQDEVIESQTAAAGYDTDSLDRPATGEEHDRSAGATLADRMGQLETAFELVEDLHTLKPLLDRLDARDRRILELRFGHDLTQAEIGSELGISQMHVSRLLSRCLRRLRAGMSADE
jgi:RNA polymerase sigma-B factor